MTRVLIADDHPFLRAGLEAILQNSAYDVVASVGDGAEALSACERESPDILILDVSMPKLNGVQVVEELRSRPNRPRVVLLTAQLGDEQLIRAIGASVDAILFKDGAEEMLISCLDRVRSGRKVIPAELLERALRATAAAKSSGLGTLAPRERSIVDLVARGMRNRDIADRLSMSEGTVKVYLHEIYQKVGVNNRTELAVLVHSSEQ